MNSGCYNEEISKILISIKTINHSGLEKIYYKEDLDFFIEVQVYQRMKSSYLLN